MYQDKVAQEQIQQAAQLAAYQAEIAAKQASSGRGGYRRSHAGGRTAEDEAEGQAASDLARQLASLEVGGIDVGAEIKSMVQQATAALG